MYFKHSYFFYFLRKNLLWFTKYNLSHELFGLESSGLACFVTEFPVRMLMLLHRTADSRWRCKITTNKCFVCQQNLDFMEFSYFNYDLLETTFFNTNVLFSQKILVLSPCNFSTVLRYYCGAGDLLWMDLF